MKAYQYAFFTSILLIAGAAIFPNSAIAEVLRFPFPHGKVYITNGYGGSDTHQKDSLYALDFRSYQGSDPCDSYGAPILAVEPGEVFWI